MSVVFKELLKKLREEKNWTKAETARKLGVTGGAYSNWEYGNREPNIDMLQTIAELFDVSVNYLINGNKDLLGNDMPVREFAYYDYELIRTKIEAPNKANTIFAYTAIKIFKNELIKASVSRTTCVFNKNILSEFFVEDCSRHYPIYFFLNIENDTDDLLERLPIDSDEKEKKDVINFNNYLNAKKDINDNLKSDITHKIINNVIETLDPSIKISSNPKIYYIDEWNKIRLVK